MTVLEGKDHSGVENDEQIAIKHNYYAAARIVWRHDTEIAAMLNNNRELVLAVCVENAYVVLRDHKKFVECFRAIKAGEINRVIKHIAEEMNGENASECKVKKLGNRMHYLNK